MAPTGSARCEPRARSTHSGGSWAPLAPSSAVGRGEATTDAGSWPPANSPWSSTARPGIPQSQIGSFFVAAKRVSSPAGCSTLPSTGFDAAPISGTVDAGGDVDCLTVPQVQPGDRLDVEFRGPGGTWTVVDAGGESVCRREGGSTCTLSGVGTYRLLAYHAEGGTFSYSLAMRRLTNPQGCSSLGAPGVWSYTGPRVSGAIDVPLGARCFTFSRAAGEDDGAYWFRSVRTAGTLAPHWRVIGPSGGVECSGSNGRYDRCQLLASGQYALVVADASSGIETGSFLVTAKRVTSPSGCVQLPSVSFAAAPVAGSLTTAGEVDCHELPEVETGDRIALEVTGAESWTVVDGAGASVCQDSGSSECALTGAPGWTLLVYHSEAGTFSYSVAVRRLTNPQGCVPLGAPDVWSFTAPRVNGTIDASARARCYTFTREPGEEDGAYWFRSVRTAGNVSPRWRVYGPTGAQECNGSLSPYQPCTLLAGGTFVLVVEASGGDQNGSFYVAAKRTTSPTGCASLPSPAFGLGPVNGRLSAAGEIDCYTLPGSDGDTLSFDGTGALGQLAVVGPNGAVQCRQWLSQCTLTGDGPFQVLVAGDSGTETGSYHFEATCHNVPCGQSDTAVTDVFPSRVGPTRFGSVLLRGRDLDLLQTARLIRGGQAVTGKVQEAAPDGRTTEVRFDLGGAPTGKWQLEATFIDGTVRTLPDALTVEPLRPADVSAQLVGRQVFRAGQPTTVTVELANTGNVDGLAVPLVLRGIPAGATIEPLFTLIEPTGNAQAHSFHDIQFDQVRDTLAAEDGLVVPFLVPRVPAGRSVRMELQITVPQATTYSVRAYAGRCLVPEATGSALTLSSRAMALSPDEVTCLGAIAGGVADVVVGKDCVSFGADATIEVIEGLSGGDGYMTWSGPWDFLLSAGDCGVDLTIGKIKRAKKALELADRATDVGGTGAVATELFADCLLMPTPSTLEQQAVTSIDPNDIVGPSGNGDQRYIPGDEPLGYQVLFENLPAATAPAQRVEIIDQLDTARFDPASVLFQDVKFGSTVYSLPYASHELDHTIDLRPAQDMLVHVTGDVSSGGQIRWVLQAIDPETLAPPDDPLAGFLPPNATAPEGEGHVSFSARTKNLLSGDVVANQASITFDSNAPIETPTWTNVIDRLAPSAAVSAQGTAHAEVAKVSWSGTDDAAGISLWEIRVSKDGGPFTLWRTSASAGSDTFTAVAPGTYSFRAVAHDGAGNVAQSAQSAVALSAPAPPGPEGPSGPQPSEPASGSTSPAPSASTPPVAKPGGAPRAKVTKHPRARLVLAGGRRKATVKFAFTASAAPAGFTCKLDRRVVRSCRSPFAARVGPGRHRFSVATIGPGGIVGRPAAFTFRVIGQRAPHR